MLRFGWKEPLNNENGRNRADVKGAFVKQKESLYWTASMITGNTESAEQSIVDATGLANANGGAFRDWLVEWAHVATARGAVNAVRSSIGEAASKYADSSCSHRRHEPLSPAEAQLLHEMNALAITERLDVLARTVLVLYGCLRLSFSDCTLFLNLPLQSVLGAYCRARHWFTNSAAPTERIRHADSRQLHALRHDPDGVAVWG